MESIYKKIEVVSSSNSLFKSEKKYKYFIGNLPVSPEFIEAKIYHDRFCLYASGITHSDIFIGFGMYDLQKREPVIPDIFNSMAYDSITGLIICKNWWSIFDDDTTFYESWVYDLNGNCIIHGNYDTIEIIGTRYILVGRNYNYGLYTVKGKLLRNVGYDSISVIGGNRFYINIMEEKIINEPFGKVPCEYTGELLDDVFFHSEECFRSKYYQEEELELYSREELKMGKYAIIEQNGKKGLLKINGELVVPIEYDQIKSGINRIVCIRGNQSFSYIEEDFPIKSVNVQNEKKNQGSPANIIVTFPDNKLTLTEKSVHYVFFDTETTGVPGNYDASSSDIDNWPRLVQLSWISEDVHGHIINQGDYIIKPEGFRIPVEASAIHGITTAKALKEGIALNDALNKFIKDAGNAIVLVGHNVGFDMKVVGCEFFRKNSIDPLKFKKAIDTMISSTEFCAIQNRYGEYKWPKLQELHKKLFGYTFEDAHNSWTDIKVTERCFWEMKKRKII